MPIYQVIFRNDAQSAVRDFAGETPEHALVLARIAYEECPDCFWFEAYDKPVSEIAVRDRKGYERAIWYSADRRLQLAARDLLTAAEAVIARWQEGDFAEAVRDLNAVVAQVRGEWSPGHLLT